MAPASRSRWILTSLCALGLLATSVPTSTARSGGPAPAPWAGARKTQGVAAVPTGPNRSAVGTPILASCGDQIDGGRCGTIEVWADPRFPKLGTLQVGFVRFPRLDRQSPSQGTIVAVEGGPGYSTIGTRSWYLDLFRPLMQHRSLLLMDLRGTGRSDAIDCPALQTWRTDDHTMSWAAAEAACAKQLGPLASRYGSAFAADDLATLLAGLHVDGIDLYGDSYGTFFAQTFAVRHPDLVDTLTLDAAYPIEGTDAWWRDLNRAALAAVRRSCERDPMCHGNTIAVLRDLVRRVRRDPISGIAPDADGRSWDVAITPASMNVALSYSGYSSPIDRELVAASRAALRPDPDPLPLMRILAENEWHYGGGNVHVYSQGLASATACNDYPMLWDRFTSVSARRQAFKASVTDLERTDPTAFDPVRVGEWAWSPSAAFRSCLRWPAPQDYVPPFPDGGGYPDVPTLVLVGEFDSVTSPEGSQQVAANFPDSTFVEVPNSYHVTALGDRERCVERIVLRFVRTDDAGVTSCVHRYPPIRVQARFPSTASEVRGPDARRASVIASGTVGDVMARWSSMYGYDGVGLRGGTFHTVGLWTPHWRLRGVRWVQDVPVDGAIESDLRTGRSSAHVTLRGGGLPASTLLIRWNSQQPDRLALVTGSVGGASVHRRVPPP